MTYSGDEDDEFCSVEPNLLQKKHKNNQKIRVRFDSVRN